MATRSTTTLVPDQLADANLRGWAQFIEDTFVTTGGWVVTADTGQTTPGALVHTASTNTAVGYRVYRMADTLQATAPVFIKVEFGSGPGAGWPSIWITVGTGSNGTGSITGTQYGRQQLYLTASATTSLTNNSYGSADTNRVQFALWIQSSDGNYPVVFSLERSKNAAGADTGDGLIYNFARLSSEFTAKSGQFAYIKLSGSQPGWTFTPSFILAMGGYTYLLGWLQNSASSANMALAQVLAFAGPAVPSGLGVMVGTGSDYCNEGTFDTVLYGTSHRYRNLRSNFQPVMTYNGNSNFSTWSYYCYFMRYE